MAQELRISQSQFPENAQETLILMRLALAIQRQKKAKLLKNRSCTCWRGNRRAQTICLTCSQWFGVFSRVQQKTGGLCP